jgi:general secretion pathway protein L
MTRLLLSEAEGFATLADSGGPVVVALPGDDIALHRLSLAETGRRAQREELAMKVADLVATDPAGTHVATGAADDQGRLWVAIMRPESLEAHLARIAAEGFVPQAVVPAPLLLPEPEAGTLATATSAPLVLVRSGSLAAAVEPALVPAIAAGADVPAPRPLAELLRSSPVRADALPLDLRQGRFAPPVRWWTERRWQIAAALLALLAVILALVPLVAGQVRANRLVAAYDAATTELAGRATGRPMDSAEDAAQALALARRQREGSGIAPRLSFAIAALAAEPEALLASVRLSPGTPLTLRLEGPADALNAAARALAAGPFESRQQGSTVTLGGLRAPGPAGDAPPEVMEAEARFLAARANAAFIAQSPPPAAPTGTASAHLGKLLAAAGLEAEPTSRNDGATALLIPAVRSQVLLPLIADIEAAGLRIPELAIDRNDDQTLRASIIIQEMPR